MTTFEFILIGIGIGVVQVGIIMLAYNRGWDRGYKRAIHDIRWAQALKQPPSPGDDDETP